MNLFQKKLEDIVRGARLSDIDLITYNSQVLAEVKDELKSRDPDIKSGAVIKLFYVTIHSQISLISYSFTMKEAIWNGVPSISLTV